MTSKLVLMERVVDNKLADELTSIERVDVYMQGNVLSNGVSRNILCLDFDRHQNIIVFFDNGKLTVEYTDDGGKFHSNIVAIEYRY